MARGKPHDDQTKAAVIAALMAGQGVSEVAKSYDLPYRTVADWAESLDFAELRNKKATEFGSLVGEYLFENLTTLKAQVVHFRDKIWLQSQTASDLAVLHGVQADKAFRLLEAIERANAANAEERAAGGGDEAQP
jgi:hypothetical protein